MGGRPTWAGRISLGGPEGLPGQPQKRKVGRKTERGHLLWQTLTYSWLPSSTRLGTGSISAPAA